MQYARIENDMVMELWGTEPVLCPALIGQVEPVDDGVQPGMVRDGQGGFIEPEPEPRTLLLPLEFQSRFTTAEKRAIDAAADANDGIYEIKSAFRAAVEIDLQSNMTYEAMAGLVAAGIMTQERADEILTPVRA